MRIETNRLLIRDLETDDAGFFAVMALDGSLNDIGFDKECGEWIAEWIVEAKELADKDDPKLEYLAYSITLKNEGTVIGSVGCSYYEDIQEAGITYFLGEQYRNKGYAAEAVKAYVSFFLEHYDVPGMIATIRDENASSWKVVEKTGFRLTEKKMYKDLNDKEAVMYRFCD